MEKTYSRNDVKQHNTLTDCWIIIDNKVYDVTKFLDEHPGGDTIIVENSGDDCTELFKDIGHSRGAIKILDDYLIGILKAD